MWSAVLVLVVLVVVVAGLSIPIAEMVKQVTWSKPYDCHATLKKADLVK